MVSMRRVVLFSSFFALFQGVHAFADYLQQPDEIQSVVSPRGVAVGDVLGNGQNDLIVAGFGSSTFIGQAVPPNASSVVQVFSPGFQGLQLSQTIQTASSPRSVLAFDLNPTGAQALLVTAYGSNLLQLFQYDGGHFIQKNGQPTQSMPVGVAVGAVHDGGPLFAAVANYGSNSISLYPIQNGALGVPVTVSVDAGPTQLAIGPLLGDGTEQIAVACLVSGKVDLLSVPVGTSDGGLSAYRVTRTVDLAPGSVPSDLKMADINGDGKQDLIVSDFNMDTLQVFLQETAGFLQPLPAVKTTGSHPNGLQTAVFGKGSPAEVIVANRDSDSLDIFQWSGVSLNLVQTLKTSDDVNSAYGPVEIGVLDTTGTGNLDLVVSHMRSNSLKVFKHSSSTPPLVNRTENPTSPMANGGSNRSSGSFAPGSSHGTFGNHGGGFGPAPGSHPIHSVAQIGR